MACTVSCIRHVERENSCSPGFLVELGQPCAPQVVITGHEAPSTDKRLREDLYKKVMSGDPVAARLPYAILAKMVTFSGWNRFEMNDSLKFHG